MPQFGASQEEPDRTCCGSTPQSQVNSLENWEIPDRRLEIVLTPPPQCQRSFLNCQPGPILQNKSHSHTIGEAVNHRFSNLSEVTGGRRSPRWSRVSVLPVRGEPAGNAHLLPGNAADISGLHHRTTSPPANPLPPSTALGAQNSTRIITRQTLFQREHQKISSWKTTG